MPGGKHLNMQAWAPEEDQIILDMVAAEGPKWSRIVMRLPGRTVSSVRNRWQRIEKGRKLREQGIESKNRCHQCGEPKRGHVCFAKLKGGPQVVTQSSLGRIEPPLLQLTSHVVQPQLPQPQVQVQAQPDYSRLPLPAPTNGLATQMLLAPPPPRRLRSSERLVAPPPSDAHAQRLRQHLKAQNRAESFYGAGSSLFPPAADASVPLFVDVAAANGAAPPLPAQPAPPMMRSDTSFFRGLAESESFSPCTRELFESWASSPRENAMPSAVAAAANDTAAPLPLKRFASGECEKAPKLTRSVSAYLANPHQLQPLQLPQPPPKAAQQSQPAAQQSQPAAPPPLPEHRSSLEHRSSAFALPLVDSDAAAIIGFDARPPLFDGRPPLESKPSLTRRRSSRLSISCFDDLV